MLKTKSYCIDLGVGTLIEDAKSDLLFAPDRAADRESFFAHLDECESCRDAMLEHANNTVIEQVVIERGASIDDIVNELSQAAEALQKSALRKGITLSEALDELLGRNKQMTFIAGEKRF
jgi:predicted anti-sigma-YlaC factor YlaD